MEAAGSYDPACLEGRFRQGVDLHVPRSGAVRIAPQRPLVTTGFPPALAWKWHAVTLSTATAGAASTATAGAADPGEDFSPHVPQPA